MCFVFMTLVSCRSERIPLLLLVLVDEFRVGAGRCVLQHVYRHLVDERALNEPQSV